jgi:EmrB/QacA subfamily drug resistance transporter
VPPAQPAPAPPLSGARPATDPTDKRRLRLLFVGLMVGLLLSELDQTVFATALPTIVGELHGIDHMLWVTTAYAVAGTVMMPVYGKLGDLLGRKRLFLFALSIFVVGSVIGALAPGMGWLIAGRAVQGLGGGGLLILIQAIVADIIPARERAPYMSVIGAVFALSAVLGPFLGGWFAEGIGWRWALWINLPLGGVAIALAATLLHVPAGQMQRVRVDVWGFTTLATAVTAVVLLASWGGTRYPWGSPVVLSVAAVAVGSGLAFVAVERRAAEPILPLHLFTQRNFTVATLAGLVMAVAMFGAIGYVPTYLQMVNGLTARDSGLVMLALIAGVMTTTLLSAQIVRRTGRYKWLPVVGTGVVAVALGLLSSLQVSTGLPVTCAFLFVLGAGIGCALEILVIIVQNTVRPTEVGTATAATSFFREIGVSLGSAVVGTLFTSRLTSLLVERVPAGSGSALERTGLAPDRPDGTGLDPNALVPAQVHRLPAALREPVISAYHDALTPVFLYLVPVMLLSMIALCFVSPVPLATSVADPSEATDPAEATDRAAAARS